MEIAIDYSQLNLLLSELEHHASTIDILLGQISYSQVQSYPSLKTVREDLQTQCRDIRQLKVVLEAILAEYSTTENRLRTFSSSGHTQTPITSYVEETNAGQALSSSPQNLQPLFASTAWNLLGSVSKATSFMKDVEDYSGWIDVLFDSEMFGDISNFLSEINKSDIFKITGYLGDGKKLIDALNNGNIDSLESLAEKYLKRGIKSGIKLFTGVKVSGVISSVYLDLGWNLGENTVENIHSFFENPSIETGLSSIWNITAGTLFDTGTGLTKDFFSAIGDITGQGFDAEDFGNAMDYLWHHPVKSAIATGEVIIDGVASFFDWLF